MQGDPRLWSQSYEQTGSLSGDVIIFLKVDALRHVISWEELPFQALVASGETALVDEAGELG